jgi:hypothetical protein
VIAERVLVQSGFPVRIEARLEVIVDVKADLLQRAGGERPVDVLDDS